MFVLTWNAHSLSVDGDGQGVPLVVKATQGLAKKLAEGLADSL